MHAVGFGGAEAVGGFWGMCSWSKSDSGEVCMLWGTHEGCSVMGWVWLIRDHNLKFVHFWPLISLGLVAIIFFQKGNEWMSGYRLHLGSHDTCVTLLRRTCVLLPVRPHTPNTPETKTFLFFSSYFPRVKIVIHSQPIKNSFSDHRALAWFVAHLLQIILQCLLVVRLISTFSDMIFYMNLLMKPYKLTPVSCKEFFFFLQAQCERSSL